MKQDIRSSAWFKAITLLLTLACAVAATFGWLYCCFSWDSLFDNNYTYSIGWNQAMSAKHSHLLDVLEDYDTQRRDQSLGYLEEQFYRSGWRPLVRRTPIFAISSGTMTPGRSF